MRWSVYFFWTIFILSSCSRNHFNETQQGNIFLRNNKVYYQKKYNSLVSLTSVEESIKLYNTPYGGFQIKEVNNDVLNGVMVNYQLNWDINQEKPYKVPEMFKQPVNATFEIEKVDNSYTVTVNNIWFTSNQEKKQTNVTLESLVLKKNYTGFLNKKQNIEILALIDKNFTTIFQLQNKHGDLRF